MPIRIQRRRTKGWRMPEGAVYVGRSSDFGNPFRVGKSPCLKTAAKWEWKLRFPERITTTAIEAVKMFRLCLSFDDASNHVVRQELRGKDLACWCPLDQPCHADVLLELARRSDDPFSAPPVLVQTSAQLKS